MKRMALVLGIIIMNFFFLKPAQIPKVSHKYSNYYYQRASLFALLPVHRSDIIFLGDSITNGCEWDELFNNRHCLNRGIGGDVVEGVYDRLGPILNGKPQKIFLMIGINDIARGRSPANIIHGIGKIADRVKEKSPRTKLYLQSILPVNITDFNTWNRYKGHKLWGKEIIETNKMLRSLCRKKHLLYIDLYDSFKEPGGTGMNPKYTNGGMHLLGAGYRLWKKIITPYVQ